MSIVTKTRTYNTGDNLPAGYYNADRDEIIAGVNSIDNAQVSLTAGILESKLLFSIAGGHHHDGVDSRLILASWSQMDFTGLTANYPVFINATADGLQTHKIGNGDVDGAAAIAESKIAFDPTAGHAHNGTTSKKIPTLNLDVTGLTPLQFLRINATATALETAPAGGIVPRTYILVDFKDLFIETDASPNPYVDTNISVTAITGYVKNAPTGTGIICVVKIVGGATIGTLTIPAGSNWAQLDLSGSPVAVTAGVFLELDITQVGSVVTGTKLTVSVTATNV